MNKFLTGVRTNIYKQIATGSVRNVFARFMKQVLVLEEIRY